MPLILGAQSAIAAGYSIDNSCRFEAGASQSMLKISSAGDQDKWTVSIWVKRGTIGATQYMTSWYQDNSNYTAVYFEADDTINFLNQIGGGISGKLNTTRVFRDPSAWYHIVAVYDSGNAEAGDRQQIWVNGVRETDFITESNVSLNEDSIGNKSGDDTILGQKGDGGVYLSGYLAEVVLLDGTAATPTSFGEFNSASPTIWQPIDVSGLTFGTNGFHCDFEDSANLGNDANGGTDLTETNFAAVDQCTDSPTNNFSTLNPVDNYYVGRTFTNGNNTDVTVSGKFAPAASTLGMNAGKWYWEVKPTSRGAGVAYIIGVFSTQSIAAASELGTYANDWGYDSAVGEYRNNDSNTSYGDTYDTDDIIGVALDLTNSKLYFAKNGTWQDSGDPTSGATGTGAISITAVGSTPLGAYFSGLTYWASNTGTFSTNFGNPPYVNTSDAADENGYGKFEYAPPSGYLALCTKNLGSDGG